MKNNNIIKIKKQTPILNNKNILLYEGGNKRVNVQLKIKMQKFLNETIKSFRKA